MSFLASQRIQKVALHVPPGSAWADVETESGAVAPGPATLMVGNVALIGTVLPGQSGENGPSSWAGRWINGAAWLTVLPPRPPYQNDGGVRLSTVLDALAKDCGAVIVKPSSDPFIGPFWTRALVNADGSRRTGRDELAALVRGRFVEPWWVDPLNVTHFGTRPGIPIVAAHRILSRDLAHGLRTIGTESPLAFMPGNIVEGQTIARSIIREVQSNLIVETWTS